MSKRTLVLPDFARYFFTLVVGVVLFLFAWVIFPFFNILIYAALVVVIFYPVYQALLRYMKGHADLASFISLLFVILLVLVPLALFTIFLAQEAVSAYGLLSSKWLTLHVDTLQWSGLDQLPVIGPWLESFGNQYGFSSFIYNTNIDLIQVVQEVAQTVATFLVKESGNFVGAVSSTLLYLLIFLITVFFFFRDGETFIKKLKFLSPLPEKYETQIENKLIDTIYGIVMGNFGSAFLQGLTAAVGFLIAGVDNVIFWATLTAFAALLPYLGAALVWVPIAVALFVQGQMVWAVFLVLWGICIVSVVDNIARPILIGSRSKMHPLLTFLVVLGGIFVFGIKGIIFGPLILSLTITILHIYQLEYEDMLKN